MLKRNWKIFFVILSQCADLAAIWSAGGVIFYLKWTETIRYVTPDSNLVIGLTVFSLIYLTIATMFGLYRGSFHLSLRLQNLVTARAFVVSILIALALNSLSQTFIGKKSVITFGLLLPVLLLLTRVILRKINLYFQKLGYGVRNALIVGDSHEAERLYYRFLAFPELGYRTCGFIVEKKFLSKSLSPQYLPDELEQVIEREQIDRIFIPSRELSLNGHMYLQPISQRKGIKLKIVSPLAEELLKVSKIYDIAGITITSPVRRHIDPLKLLVKRIFDLVVSIIIILVLSPIFLVTIIAIYLESGRPIFFMQKRSSIKGGKEFNFIKFRSMVTNAEQLRQELLDKNEADGALFKMKNDPRVTKVGRIIRKLSIDELPQLFNVVKGDMSLVGPRPLPLSDFEIAHESEEFWRAIKERGAVKPGMTGLWQISGRSNIKFREMILLDLYYVENHSLMFDLEILFETIPVVFAGRGAY